MAYPRALLIGLAAMASACAPIPAAPTGPETISYRAGPCFGVCPAYRLTVSSDGVGVFEGFSNTASTGVHRFRVTPAQYAAFRDALAPYRPRGVRDLSSDSAECGGRIATDLPSYDVRWTGAGGDDHLDAYAGCDRERFGAIYDALGKAPRALALQRLIGGN